MPASIQRTIRQATTRRITTSIAAPAVRPPFA
jgi:hypothetical protein